MVIFTSSCITGPRWEGDCRTGWLSDRLLNAFTNRSVQRVVVMAEITEATGGTVLRIMVGNRQTNGKVQVKVDSPDAWVNVAVTWKPGDDMLLNALVLFQPYEPG